MIFKIVYNSQAHLYNKTISLKNIIEYSKKVFRSIPQSFTFIYQSPRGQMTYIQTDQDLIGLKYCCTTSNDLIVKLTIMEIQKFDQFDLDEDIETLNIVRENIESLEENIFINLEQESTRQLVSEYLEQTYEKISKQVAEAEQKLIREQVKGFLQDIYERSSRMLAETEQTFIVEKPKTRKTVRFSPEKVEIKTMYKSEKKIEELVNEKVLEMIPSIVQKIYSKMEQKLHDKCHNCLKKQIQLENLIDSEIQRRILASSFSKLNPEE